MNDLIRPTLYDAFHDIRPVRAARRRRRDDQRRRRRAGLRDRRFSGHDRDLPRPTPGDLVAVMTAGAYGAVQAGTYNSRLLVPEVLVSGARFAVVRRRPSYDDLIGLDSVPDWLD